MITLKINKNYNHILENLIPCGWCMKRLVVIKPYKEAILTHNNVSTVPFLKYLWFSDVISYLNVNVHKILKGALTGMEFIASVTR